MPLCCLAHCLLQTERRASLFWLEGRAKPRDSKAYYSPCIHATRRHPKVKGYRLANLLARSECSSSRMPFAIRWLILSALRAAGLVAWLSCQPFPIDSEYYTKNSLIAHRRISRRIGNYYSAKDENAEGRGGQKSVEKSGQKRLSENAGLSEKGCQKSVENGGHWEVL